MLNPLSDDETDQEVRLADLAEQFAMLQEQVERYAQVIRQIQNPVGQPGFGGTATSGATGSSVSVTPARIAGGIGVPPVYMVSAQNLGITGTANRIAVQFKEPVDAAFVIDHYAIYTRFALGTQYQEVLQCTTHTSPAIFTIQSSAAASAIIVVQTVLKNGQCNAIPDCPSTTVTLTDPSLAILPVSQGGTGLGTLTAHALYVGNGTSPPTALSVGATGTVLHGNTGANPSFSSVSLSADVSGTLPVANGGTGTSTGSITGPADIAFTAGGTAKDLTLTSATTGKVILKPGTNSTAAVQAQQADGTPVWTVDATNKRMGVVEVSPAATIEARGPNLDAATSGTTCNGIIRASQVSGFGVADIGFGQLAQAWIQATNSTDQTIQYALALNPNGGNVGVATNTPTHALEVAVDDAAKPTTNTWTITSDARIKKNVAPFTDGLAVIRKLAPVTYEYNGKARTKTGDKGIGLLAQDAKPFIPYCITTKRDKLNHDDATEVDLHCFNSHALLFVLINAIGELEDRLKKLEK